MARPRNDSNVPDAERRLKDAFWTLLTKYQIRDITVDMLVREARCHRGTFYYHYKDVDDVVFRSIEEDLLNNKLFLDTIFYLTFEVNAGASSEEGVQLDIISHRLSLLIQRGGISIIGPYMKEFVAKRWNEVLSTADRTLNDHGRLILEFAVSGILGALEFRGRDGGDIHLTDSFAKDSFLEIYRFTISHLAEVEDLSEDEIAKCLETFNHRKVPDALLSA